MDTRFTLVCGSLVLVVALATGVIPIPHSSAIVPVVDAAEPQARSESAKTNSTDVRDSQPYGEVRSGLFSRPSPPESVPPIAQTASVAPQTTAVDPPLVIDPFAQVVYTGTVTIGEEKQALLENQRTKEGWYLHQGDPFMGAKIVRIDDNAITLNVHGQMRRIPKSNVYNLVPLDFQAGASTDRSAAILRGPNGEVINRAAINGTAFNGAMPMGALSGNGAEGYYQSTLGAAKAELDNAVAQKYSTLSTLSNDISVSYETVPINNSISVITSDVVTPDATPAQVEFKVGLVKDDGKL